VLAAQGVDKPVGDLDPGQLLRHQQDRPRPAAPPCGKRAVSTIIAIKQFKAWGSSSNA